MVNISIICTFQQGCPEELKLKKKFLYSLCLCIPNLAPAVVISNTVNGQGNHLYASFLELIADVGSTGELSGAYRSEVPRVGEQDTPSAGEKRCCSNSTRPLFGASIKSKNKMLK